MNRLDPLRSAARRSAHDRSARWNDESRTCASTSVAAARFAPSNRHRTSWAPSNSAPRRSAPLKSQSMNRTPLRSAPGHRQPASSAPRTVTLCFNSARSHLRPSAMWNLARCSVGGIKTAGPSWMQPGEWYRSIARPISSSLRRICRIRRVSETDRAIRHPRLRPPAQAVRTRMARKEASPRLIASDRSPGDRAVSSGRVILRLAIRTAKLSA